MVLKFSGTPRFGDLITGGFERHLHALDGGSATFSFDRTCSIQIGHEKFAAINQNIDGRARPNAFSELPRIKVPDAASLSMHNRIGLPGVRTFAIVKPKTAPVNSNS